ncbi:hypothetical protein F4777DRAFT_591366 [Nemania sp. FL0916]|nr:hypothetical protein F4777DRAFT_591366 [Nemania sp. FL0916]
MSHQRQPTLTAPHSSLRVRSPLRAKSPSPSRPQHPSDDLISRLTPATAAHALQSPTGALKTCLDKASTSEQAFALRTAIASKSIYDWFQELSDWHWPSENTAAGFEAPSAKRRSLFETPSADEDTTLRSDTVFIGSLPAGDVVQYGQRIEQIHYDLESLNLEEIKNQVLYNHILPLSRPGTPFSDAGRSTASAFSYSKMEDLTAVVTMITVQTLPVLSKLSRLLRIWGQRLTVLRKVPSLLGLFADAEVALSSAWGVLQSPSSSRSGSNEEAKATPSTTQLSHTDFEVIRVVLQSTVNKLGRDLDFMLDTLEGMADTLPEEWLDRAESIERDYTEWVITAEQKDITRRPTKQVTTDSDARTESSEHALSTSSGITVTGSGSQALPSSSSRTLHVKATGEQPRSPTFDGSEDVEDARRGSHQDTILSEMNQNIVRQSATQPLRRESLLKSALEDDFEPSILESANGEDEEPELPPTFVQARKGSDPSATFTAFPGSSNYSPEYSDYGTFRELSTEPELPLLPDPDEPFSSDAPSPPSSPPLRYNLRSTSATFRDIPEIGPLPDVDDSPPRTPLEPPVLFDPDASFEWESQLGSPCHIGANNSVGDDDHLQTRLRQLLETIPAKIELKKRGIDLHPPDLQLPARPKPRHSDRSRRPTSALSSRADSRVGTPFSRSGTPAFMLAPVRDTRPRSKSSQGIRLYHLSRSGETPIKLFVRLVGEQNERVMVRVGGGWSDLGEYLRDYAIHHGSRSKGEGKVEVIDAAPATSRHVGSSPGSRPGSALGSPMTPLTVRKTRKDPTEEMPSRAPKTPLAKRSILQEYANTPGSEASVKSQASSNVDWDEEDSSLGLAGPKAAKRRDISDESRAWIESVKHKVRLASGERIAASISSEHLRSLSSQAQTQAQKKTSDDKFGEMGRVGGTRRLFRKN